MMFPRTIGLDSPSRSQHLQSPVSVRPQQARYQKLKPDPFHCRRKSDGPPRRYGLEGRGTISPAAPLGSTPFLGRLTPPPWCNHSWEGPPRH